MTYHFSTLLEVEYDEAIDRITKALQQEGFGVLSEINISTIFKNKLEVDIPEYRILGACNPAFAYKALQVENKIGTMLPCNVVVQEQDNHKIKVSIVDPVASMQAIENPELQAIALEVQSKLKRVIENL